MLVLILVGRIFHPGAAQFVIQRAHYHVDELLLLRLFICCQELTCLRNEQGYFICLLIVAMVLPLPTRCYHHKRKFGLI